MVVLLGGESGWLPPWSGCPADGDRLMTILGQTGMNIASRIMGSCCWRPSRSGLSPRGSKCCCRAWLTSLGQLASRISRHLTG